VAVVVAVAALLAVVVEALLVVAAEALLVVAAEALLVVVAAEALLVVVAAEALLVVVGEQLVAAAVVEQLAAGALLVVADWAVVWVLAVQLVLHFLHLLFSIGSAQLAELLFDWSSRGLCFSPQLSAGPTVQTYLSLLANHPLVV
jgi:hypothetical protein